MYSGVIKAARLWNRISMATVFQEEEQPETGCLRKAGSEDSSSATKPWTTNWKPSQGTPAT